MENSRYKAPAADKAISILETMAGKKENHTVTELANGLRISTNSVFRILKELESRQYVKRDAVNSSYKLTGKLYFLGNSLKSRFSLVNETADAMRVVRDQTMETVILTILTPDMLTLLVEQVESPFPIKFSASIGNTYDSYSTATGKCMLAFSGDAVIKRYLDGVKLEPKTLNTITSKKEMYKELTAIKENGVAYDNEESVLGLKCIACPIISSLGKLEGAVGISGASFRMTNETIPLFTGILKKECSYVSNRLS
ncbi:MAG: IclR family transcriptional regulator [Clostridia bacterium]|nr:IclR family transcriptional regulator [Clostridia bacterium]